jgi:hypothetical protein
MPSKKTSAQSAPPTAQPRRRGAPPGNLNALKHGLYSKFFRDADLDQLHASEEQDVSQEIELLRLIIQRTTERSADAQTFDDQLRFLRILAYATSQLTHLLNIQKAYRKAQRSKETDASLNEIEAAMRRNIVSHLTSTMDRPSTTTAQAPTPAGTADPPRPADPTPEGDSNPSRPADPTPAGITDAPRPADSTTQPSLFNQGPAETPQTKPNKFWPTFIEDDP